MSSCVQCGASIPDGQGGVCSMCYGDPNWGSDDYYNRWIQEQFDEEQRREQEEQRQEATDE